MIARPRNQPHNWIHTPSAVADVVLRGGNTGFTSPFEDAEHSPNHHRESIVRFRPDLKTSVSPVPRRLQRCGRRAARRAFNAIVPATNVALAHLDFRVTAGDEFQFVLGDSGRALETVFLMRSRLAQEPMEPMVRFRASIGVGPVRYRPTRGAQEKPYEWVAFRLSEARP